MILPSEACLASPTARQTGREISCPNCCAARYLLTPGELPDRSHLETASFSMEVTFVSPSCGGGFSIVYFSAGFQQGFMHVRLSRAVVGCCCSPLSPYHHSVLILVKRHFLIDPQCRKKNWFPHSELLLHMRCFWNGRNYFVLLPGRHFTNWAREPPPWRGRGKVCLIVKRGYGKIVWKVLLWVDKGLQVTATKKMW